MVWTLNIEYWYGVLAAHLLALGISTERIMEGETTSYLQSPIDDIYADNTLRIVNLALDLSMFDRALVSATNEKDGGVHITLSSEAWNTRKETARSAVETYKTHLAEAVGLYKDAHEGEDL